MVLISAWMPAPPLESLPAIVNAVFILFSLRINFVRARRCPPRSWRQKVVPPICRCDISFFLLLPYRRKRPKKVQEPNAKIPAQITLVTYYLPTLALSKSGSGLKHPLTLSPPCEHPVFIILITSVMVCFITALLYTPVFKMQAFCSVLF